MRRSLTSFQQVIKIEKISSKDSSEDSSIDSTKKSKKKQRSPLPKITNESKFLLKELSPVIDIEKQLQKKLGLSPKIIQQRLRKRTNSSNNNDSISPPPLSNINSPSGVRSPVEKSPRYTKISTYNTSVPGKVVKHERHLSNYTDT
jgi:hypothetical protein